VRLAILVNRPQVTARHTYKEWASSYNIIHGHYSITWPTVYPESCLQFRIQYYASHISSNSLGWSTESDEYFCVIQYMGRNPRSISKLPLAHAPSIIFPYILTANLNFLVAKGPLLYFIDQVLYLVSDWTTCLYTLKYTSGQVIVSNSIFIVSTGFHMLATGIILVALNGTKCGRHRQGQCTSER